MAKKKSKTQKYKKNLKRKLAASTTSKTKIAPKEEVIYNVAVKKSEKSTTAKKETVKKDAPKKPATKKTKIAPKEEVIYNVAVKSKEKEENASTKKPKTSTKNTKSKNATKKTQNKKTQPKKETAKKETKSPKTTKKENEIITKIKKKLKELKKKLDKKTKTKKKTNKITKKDLPKKVKKQTKNKIIEPQNKFQKILNIIVNNLHIGFNAILLITFIFLFIGFKTTEAVKTGTLFYICGILLFLIIIAISYNKYVSGKIFTILITTAMIFGIYYLNYTYAFINSFNTKVYEDKTYYVVAIDNNLNKSIYNINNKKIGLVKENNKNVERKLNTKLDKINYIEFDNLNELINSFYNQEFRAMIVTENQYKYILKEYENNKKTKVLYEFTAVSKK